VGIIGYSVNDDGDRMVLSLLLLRVASRAKVKIRWVVGGHEVVTVFLDIGRHALDIVHLKVAFPDYYVN
jgi:hypothetical protein